MGMIMAFLFGLLAGTIEAGTEQQPQAKRVEQTDIYHGVAVADPYRWLEEMDDRETMAWARAQDQYTRHWLAQTPGYADLHKRLTKVATAKRYIAPVLAGGRVFYRQYQTGVGKLNILVKEKDGSTRILLNSKELADNKRIAGMAPSPNGEILAIQLSEGTSRWRDIRFLDVATGKWLEDRLRGYHNNGSLSWSADSNSLYYSRFQLPKTGKEVTTEIVELGIYHHRLGKKQADDPLFYRDDDHQNWYWLHQLSQDGETLAITGRDGDKRKLILAKTDKQGKTQTLVESEASLSFLGLKGGKAWMTTMEDAPNGRIVAVDLNRPQREHWRELVPEAEQTLINASAIGNRFLAIYREHAIPVIKVFHTDGRLDYKMTLPKLGFLSSFSGRPSHDIAFYSLSGLADPGTLYGLDVASGKSEVLRKAELAYDPDRFITRQVFYRSKDGTRIPMFLVHRDGLKMTPETPVFLYGYGAGNWSAYPWHQPHMAVWLEMGGVYALPGIRGGGEYGYTWHEAGIGRNKQKSIDDFIAAAKWLIDEDMTSKARLAINGGSASGPLAGAAVVQEPGLFAAAVVEWPVTDMLRYEQFPGGRFWTWSNGTVKNREDFRSLHAWSPYHNITEGVCYPATLTIVGEKDESTVPAHSYKFQAALQHDQGCENPVLMRMVWGGAHYQYGTTTANSVETWADLLAFLVRTLDVKEVRFAGR